MILEKLTRGDAEFLDLDEAGLDEAAIAAVMRRPATMVRDALARHADRRGCGRWSDAA